MMRKVSRLDDECIIGNIRNSVSYRKARNLKFANNARVCRICHVNGVERINLADYVARKKTSNIVCVRDDTISCLKLTNKHSRTYK